MSDSHPEHPASRRLRDCPAWYRIAFVPVPVKPRHDGWSPRLQREFIDLLAVTGCVSRSARAVGRSRQSALNLRKHPKGASFSGAWDEALKNGRSYQLQLGIERCLEGERRPVMYQGRKVGETVRHDNSLLLRVLKALDSAEDREGDPLAEVDREMRRLRPPGWSRGSRRSARWE